MNALHTHTYKGCTIEVHQDSDLADPRKEWDCHIGTFATWHRRYTIGDIQPMESGKDYLAALPKDELVLPVYMHDHSGTSISTTPFSCPWDSGQLGIIHIGLKKARNEWASCLKDGKGRGWDRILCCPTYPACHGRTLRSVVTAQLEQEIKSVDDWLTGSVYGYVTKDPDGEEIDSCWGYYGDSEVTWDEDYAKCGYMIQCGRDSIDSWVEKHGNLELATAEAEVWP